MATTIKEALPSDFTEREPTSLAALAILAILGGAAAGAIGALFRLSLVHADRVRGELAAWAHGIGLTGFLILTTTCSAATAIASLLVRRYSPFSSGSGITHVEAVLAGELPQAPFRLIPLKFFGGMLAIGSGLALGPEGPSVQMGRVWLTLWGSCSGGIGRIAA